MSLLNVATLFFGFNSFLISIFIFLKRKDSFAHRYLLFKTFVCIWAFAISFYTLDSLHYSEALLGCRIANAAAIFIPSTWFHVVVSYVQKEKEYTVSLILSYIFSFSIFLFCFTPYFIFGVKETFNIPHYAEVGIVFHLFSAFFFVVIAYGFFILFKCFLDVEEEFFKKQILGFSVSTLCGFLGGSLTFLPAYKINFWPPLLFLMPIYPIAMAYFMTRRGLFDDREMVYAAHRNKLATIGMLATSINHEIKNPLYIIQGLAESHLCNFREGLYDNTETIINKSNEIHKKTLDLSQRSISLIKKFALFAREKSIPNVKSKTIFDLNKSVGNVLSLVEHDFQIESIYINKKSNAEEILIEANQSDLEEVLFNLLLNAKQALLERKEKQIFVLTESIIGNVCLKVADNGKGINQQEIKKIFEPFYTTKAEGTGLGLYITKQLVEKNGGKISVESKAGEGTTFALTFKQIESNLFLSVNGTGLTKLHLRKKEVVV